jgi:antitoxin ParD1/3/4
MHIRFAEVDENFIRREVEQGFYVNETELVRDAVRRLRETKQRSNRFQEAVRQGVMDIETGRTRPLTPQLMDQLVQDGVEMADRQQPYHSHDAVPTDA